MIENNPILSIIIPVYNAEKYISATLNSIVNQNGTDYEIVVVDDGSTDSSGKIVDEFKKMHNMIKVIHTENGGVSKARNIGLANVTGELVYFIDSDDIVEPGFFDRIYKSKEYDMVVYGAIFDNRIIHKAELHYATTHILENRQAIAQYLSEMSGMTKDVFLNYLWNRLFKNSIIKKGGLRFDENVKLGEDFLFISEYLALCDSVVVTDDPIYRYITRNNMSLVSRFDPNEYERRKLMQKAFLRLYDSFSIPESGRVAFYESEGANYIISMSKVFRSTCPYKTSKERIKYIDKFLDIDGRKYISVYLSNNKSKKNKLLKLCFISKNSSFMYFALWALSKF